MSICIIKSGLAHRYSVCFIKLQVAVSDLSGSFLLFFSSFFFPLIIVILNYCKEDYKVFIIRNNKLINLSRMKSCLRGWSCYHYSLAQRPICRRIHTVLATLSSICKCGILGIVCVSICCASGRGFSILGERDLPVFKLVLSLGAQITRTGTYVRTHAHRRAHVLLITMAFKQKQK